MRLGHPASFWQNTFIQGVGQHTSQLTDYSTVEGPKDAIAKQMCVEEASFLLEGWTETSMGCFKSIEIFLKSPQSGSF